MQIPTWQAANVLDFLYKIIDMNLGHQYLQILRNIKKYRMGPTQGAYSGSQRAPIDMVYKEPMEVAMREGLEHTRGTEIDRYGIRL